MTKEIIAMRTEGKGLENNNQYWSEADKMCLIHYFNEGVGISEMALKMGRSELAIVQQLMKDRMFEHETKPRCRHTKKNDRCLCEKCDEYDSCPYSPSNRKGTSNSDKGEDNEYA